MKLHRILSLAACLVALAGCSSSRTKVDTGAIHARTFNFVDRGSPPNPGIANPREPIHAVIQESITRNLTARGLNRTASGGDVVVSYLIVVGNNVSTTLINDYFGYGQDASGLHDKAHTAYTKSKNPDYFEAGTLLIDIIDAKSFKLLKRGYATRQLLKNPTADVRAARIQEVVDEILRDVRVAN